MHLDVQDNGKLRVIFESVIILQHIFYAAIDSRVKIFLLFFAKTIPI